jgi:hypothetical protein
LADDTRGRGERRKTKTGDNTQYDTGNYLEVKVEQKFLHAKTSIRFLGVIFQKSTSEFSSIKNYNNQPAFLTLMIIQSVAYIFSNHAHFIGKFIP